MVAGGNCHRTGPVSYEVNVNGQMRKQHTEQLLSRSESLTSMPEGAVSEPGDETWMEVGMVLQNNSEVMEPNTTDIEGSLCCGCLHEHDFHPQSGYPQ